MQTVTVAEVVLHTKSKDFAVVVPDRLSALTYRHTVDIKVRKYIAYLLDLFNGTTLD